MENKDSQMLLALKLYAEGKHELAKMNFEKSANQGNIDAQYNLGVCYYHGKGTTQDYTKAFEWYQKSANQGNTDAQYSLGICYYHGKGTQQDYKKASEWFEKSDNRKECELPWTNQQKCDTRKNMTERLVFLLESVRSERSSEKRKSIINEFIKTLNMHTFTNGISTHGKNGICIIEPDSSSTNMMINALSGKEIFKIGCNLSGNNSVVECVLTMHNLSFFRYPGKYLSLEHLDMSGLHFLKAMKLIIILYKPTSRITTDIIRICDALNVGFMCVCDEVDSIEEQELKSLRQGEEKNIRECISNQECFNRFYALSTRNVIKNHPETYDWCKFHSKILSLSE